MADQQQLERLKKGIATWNRWRKENPGVSPDLSESNLSGTKLQRADLQGTRLIKAHLIGAKLEGADLSGAMLINADLSGAKLLEVDLYNATLIATSLRKANLTGAHLYGTARDDWNIEGVNCDYVFWDKHGENRVPKERDFEPSEFEELYKLLPTIEYAFERGLAPIDAVIMDQVVRAINEKHPEFELKLDSFHSRVKPRAVFTVIHKEYASEALDQIKDKYETQIKVLEAERNTLENCFRWTIQ